MSLRSVKNWVADRFTESLTVEPGSYPHSAVCGILYMSGFNTSNTRIMIDRPVGTENIKTKPLLIISIPRAIETQKTGMGAYGQKLKEIYIDVDIFWVADFTSGAYTSRGQSDIMFDSLVSGVERTLSLAVYRKSQAVNGTEAPNWTITDTYFGNSTIKGQEPLISTLMGDAEKPEAGSLDVLYSARVSANFFELYSAALPGT